MQDSDNDEALKDGLNLVKMPSGGAIGHDDVKPVFDSLIADFLDSDEFAERIMSLMGTDDMKKKIKSN